MKKIASLILLFTIACSGKAQTTNYQLYSLFVLNIAKYSTWPHQATEFQIVVFGKSKIYDELAKLVSGKSINGVPIKILQVENPNDIISAHIIFVPDGKSGNLSEVTKITGEKPVIVIAEREGLYKKGAGFSFVVMDDNTLRYDINQSELDKRSIKISKNLTSLANLVI
jgi:hypothetical protein